MSYKLTKKDFKEFQAECEKWVGYFGLMDWEICYQYDDDEECRGSCTADYVGMMAIIALGKIWIEEPEKFEIRKVAFHEVCELLISPLRIRGEERFTTEHEIEAARHSIIRVLENTIFKEKTK